MTIAPKEATQLQEWRAHENKSLVPRAIKVVWQIKCERNNYQRDTTKKPTRTPKIKLVGRIRRRTSRKTGEKWRENKVSTNNILEGRK